MSRSTLPSSTRLVIALLPAAFGAHLAEEWFGGFSQWTATALGNEVRPDRFLLINLVALPIFTGCAIAALRTDKAAWLAASLATLFGLNGALHLLATLAFGQYSPGTVTGTVLYIPLAVVVLRSLSGRLAAALFFRAVAVAVVAHAGVAALAFI